MNIFDTFTIYNCTFSSKNCKKLLYFFKLYVCTKAVTQDAKKAFWCIFTQDSGIQYLDLNWTEMDWSIF